MMPPMPSLPVVGADALLAVLAACGFAVGVWLGPKIAVDLRGFEVAGYGCLGAAVALLAGTSAFGASDAERRRRRP